MTKLKSFWRRCKDFFLKLPLLSSLLLTQPIAWGWILMRLLHDGISFSSRSFVGLLGYIFVVILFATCLCYPFLLTVLNVLFLFKPRQSEELTHAGRIIEYTTIIVGVIFTELYWWILEDIQFSADYSEQLYNREIHTPIFTEAQPTLLCLGIVAAVGYLLLRWVPLEKQPPLLTVLSMAAMYIGMALCLVFDLQIFGKENIYLMLLPFNLILIGLKVVQQTGASWKQLHPADDETQFGGNKKLLALNRLLGRTCGLPLFALVMVLPLMGVLIAILSLCGQAPNAVIQAWTETAEWNFSQHTAPPNVIYDEHYLCTVAAGGHQRVVRPLRSGRRHGHEVIVNRQLCIANAFEQLLEERTPHLHRLIRGIYDSFGYPVARHLRTKTAADVVYLLMKPLEWLFLAVLYLFDIHPEDRIAVQYPHAPLPNQRKENVTYAG